MHKTIILDAPLMNVRLSSRQNSSGTSDDHYERGRRDGENAARQALSKERTDLHQLHAGILSSLENAGTSALRDSEGGLVKLAMQVAERLVAGIPISAEMVEGSIRETLAHVEDATEFQMLLHPDDLDLLRRIDSPFLPGKDPAKKITVQSSDEIGRGGCLVKTRFGIVDGRRESKAQALKQLMQAA